MRRNPFAAFEMFTLFSLLFLTVAFGVLFYFAEDLKSATFHAVGTWTLTASTLRYSAAVGERWFE
tara:strand:- start:390 stop:584 length:195 start_codon:yes stop_codon:yes gene_type:complete